MRKIGLLVFVLLLCCLSGAAFAQTSMPTFCGTLSDADCAIVTGAQEGMQSLDSVSFDLNLGVNVSNVPQMTEPLNFTLTGNGSFAGLEKLRGAATDMTAMTTDPGAAISGILSDFDGDLSLTLSLPPALMSGMGAGSTMPSDITVQIRLVDGVGYLNLDTLQPLLNSPSLKGWYGLDLANLVKEMMTQMPDMFNQMMNMQGTGNSMAYMQEFSKPEFLSKFVSIARTDDGSGDTATFETTVDLAALLSSPEFQDMMTQQMKAQMQAMGTEEAPSEADMQMGMAMSAQMMQGMTVKVSEEIGVSDSRIHSIHGTFVFDTAGMMSAMGSSMAAGLGGTEATTEAPTSTEPAPVVNVDFTLTYSDFDSVAPITAPEDATVLPYQMVLQGMMGSGSSSAPVSPTATPAS